MNTEFIQTKLASKLWRLNNLYKIRDKSGTLITMKLNESQLYTLTSFSHNKRIILKSRQQGMTTLAVAYNLDSCIFKPGFSAGIQSYGLDESKKLQLKAKLMWEEFDESIKKALNLTLVVNNAAGMQFSNGSILKIGNFRGDTLQSLHVSELAKIAKKFPDKARELKTGAFQAIGKENKIIIESTAEGKAGLFYELWQKAVMKKRMCDEAGAQLSPFDFEPIFLSWMMDPDCNLEQDQPIPDELKEYFERLEQKQNTILTQTQKNWYVAKYGEIGFDIKQEYPSTPEEAFEKVLEGTYYANEYKNLTIGNFKYDPNYLVFSAVDLGMNDTFSNIFFQVDITGVVTIIAEYMDSGHGLAYYRDVYDAFEKKYGWKYRSMFVPHDVNVKDLTSDKTRLEVLRELKFRPIVVKKHALIDGIECCRQMLKNIRIDRSCEVTIAAIQNYRKAFNDQLGVFLDKPVHDEFSHPADALRYLAMGLKYRMPSEVCVYTERSNMEYNSRRMLYDI